MTEYEVQRIRDLRNDRAAVQMDQDASAALGASVTGCLHPHGHVDVVTGSVVPTADVASRGCECGAVL